MCFFLAICIRFSCKDVNLDRQIEALKKAGAEKIFEEKMSGKSMTDREELQKALEFLLEKDILIEESLDRSK